MRGSGIFPVSRVCETVVMWARKGRRKVGGSDVRASRRDLRIVGANMAIDGVELLAGLLLAGRVDVDEVSRAPAHCGNAIPDIF